MSIVGPGRGELAKLMPDHILGNKNRNKLFSVMHRERVPNKFRDDGGPTRPGFNDRLAGSATIDIDLAQKAVLNIGPFFD
jgi:hypothetical protein